MSGNLKKYLGVLIILILPVLLLSGCGGQNAGSANNQGPIKIGWLGALSGTNAVLGKWDTNGIELAFDAVNASGGINGRQLELIKYDDKGDPSTSMDDAKKLVNDDKVVAAFATVLSTPTLADVPIFAQAQIPQITPGLATNITAQGSAYVFRDTPAGPPIENTLVDYLVKKGFKTFAQITDTTDYGKGEAQYEQTELTKYGIKPLTTQSYGPDDKDFTGQLESIIKLKPQVLLFGGSEVASGLIAKQARQLGFTGQFAGGEAIATPKFIEVAGADIANGTIFTTAYISNDANAMTQDFAKRFQAKYGYAPEAHCAKAYDGAMMLIQAIKASGTNVTGPEIAKQLHAIQGYQGLQGTFNVQPNGETITVALLGTVKDGKLTPMAQ